MKLSNTSILVVFSIVILLGLVPGVSQGSSQDVSSESETSPPEGDVTVQQPSFIDMGGILRPGEHAFVFYADAKLLPAAVMVGYRYGIFFWWEVGLDVGGNLGVFQALFHTKWENFKTKRTEFFFWGMSYDTGYKYHEVDWSDDLIFEDKSWIHDFKNSFAFRFGTKKNKVLYLMTEFYIDKDLHSPRRQNDFYFAPANVGFETEVGRYSNFFIEAGYIWAVNGMETSRGIKYEGDWFPVMKLGMAIRTGDRTAR